MIIEPAGTLTDSPSISKETIFTSVCSTVAML